MKMNLLRFFKLCRLVQFGSFWFNLVQTHFFEFTPYYIGECLPQFPSLFSYEMRSPTPLMTVSKTDTAPM